MISTNSHRLERFMLPGEAEFFSRAMKGFYGPPIPLAGVPGNVRVCGDGDFIGRCEIGFEANVLDVLKTSLARLSRRRSRSTLAVGFATLADALAAPRQRIVSNSQGYATNTAVWNSHYVGRGTAASAAPGGRACDNTTAGALGPQVAVSGKSLYLAGIRQCHEFSVSGSTPIIQSHCGLLYDRIFDVAKTMSSTATESVTGTPTRYTNTGAGSSNSAWGNFLFPEVFTNLQNLAHNWTVCTYKNEAGTAQTLPSITGVGNQPPLAIDISGIANSAWFAPLVAGDMGVSAITQLQCSASITGAVNWVIGHPIAFCPTWSCWIMESGFFPSAFSMQLINDSACLAFISLPGGGSAVVNPNCFSHIDILAG